jgi:hypothetical protein
VLHDFDKAGFTIASTLQRDTRRYRFEQNMQVIDLGLRLDDIRDLDLNSCAEQANDGCSRSSRSENLRLNGATEDEIKFLLDRRVELNALTSDELVRLIETKLTANGVRKVVPEIDILAEAYRSNIRTAKIKEIIDRAIKEMGDHDAISVPGNLADQVDAKLRENPAWRWDDAVQAVADEGRVNERKQHQTKRPPPKGRP